MQARPRSSQPRRAGSAGSNRLAAAAVRNMRPAEAVRSSRPGVHIRARLAVAVAADNSPSAAQADSSLRMRRVAAGAAAGGMRLGMPAAAAAGCLTHKPAGRRTCSTLCELGMLALRESIENEVEISDCAVWQ